MTMPQKDFQKLLDNWKPHFLEKARDYPESLYIENYEKGIPSLSCEYFHDGSCVEHYFKSWLRSFKNTYQVYAIVHLIPVLIWKRKVLKTNPLKTLKSYSLNLSRSQFFVAFYKTIYVTACCVGKNLHPQGHLLGRFCLIGAFIGSFSIF